MVICGKCGRPLQRKTKSPVAGRCRTCFNVWRAEIYFKQLERNRRKDEMLNQRSYDQARELAAWVSVYRYGTELYRVQAEKMINHIVEIAFPPFSSTGEGCCPLPIFSRKDAF